MLPRLSFLLLAALLPLAAQQIDNQQRSLTCDDSNRDWGDDDRHHFCEMREATLTGVRQVRADGRTNGGISIKGWSRGDVLVRSKVQAWAPTADEAKSIAGQVTVNTAGGDVRADAPDFGDRRGWAVSYEIFVPHRIDLSLKSHNGGVKVSDVTGDIGFETVNGGASLARLGGTVHGRTTNGGLKIELTGARWEGTEMDVSATNGGVKLEVPESYSARIETRTVNGRISVDFPITVQGRIGRELSFTLGGGGPLIRAVTTNGGVTVSRKS